MKKIVFFLLLITLCFPLFADDYSVRIINSDSLKIKDKVLVMNGSVKVAIDKTDDKEETRQLTCNQVVIDMDQQYLLASGNVLLTDSEDQEFVGDSLYLNWDTMDVLVFVGTSQTQRVNAQGEDVTFYSSAQTISYAGEENVVFFKQGVISTTEEQYWSVKAKTIALLDSDLVFENATIKIGYVPVLWVPFFFYPGTTISFNPAVGVKSDKGFFLNTTTEIYGTYPKIGTTGSGSTEETEDAIAATVFSFMKSQDKEQTVRDGIYYKPVEEVEVSNLEKWAKKNSSYMAVFVDAFETEGLSFGVETSNKFFNKKLNVDVLGLFAFKPKQNLLGKEKTFRYYWDTSVSFSIDKAKFSLKMPFWSDPDVAFDYLNRNTVFGLDSVLGNEQNFPTTYSKGKDSYTWSFNSSYSKTLGKHTFKLSSFESDIRYKWNSSKHKFEMKSATLPSLNVSLTGTIYSISKEKTTKYADYEFLTSIGKDFANQLEAYSDVESLEYESDFKPIKADELKGKDSVSTNLDLLSITYSISEKMANSYEEKFKHDDISSSLDGNIKFAGTVSPTWFSYSETFATSLSTVKEENKNFSKDFKITSVLDLNSKELGLNYNINAKLYSLVKTKTKDVKSKFEWDKEHITSHSISFQKKFGQFNVGLRETIKPVDMVMTPSVSYSYQNISVSSNIGLYLEKKQFFKKGSWNFNFKYSQSNQGAGITINYDFAKDGWKGFKLTQTANYATNDKNFSVTESLAFKDKFKGDTLKLTLNYKKQPVYFWKNRIGLEGSLNTKFTYVFENPFSSSLDATATFNFSIAKFIDIGMSLTSGNNSFYKYYNSSNKFSFKSFMKDLLKSVDIFNSRYLKQSSFVIKDFKFSLVHYMTDWNLYLDAAAGLTVENSKYVWNPKVTVMVKWNPVPELKVENSWNSLTKWGK